MRGIAIFAVILHHLSSSIFPGGFLGVDVFFVLSGFLITNILMDEIDATGRIDIKRFYVRRIRRLAPALVLLVAAYLLYAAIFLPNFIFHFGDSVLALTYTSNWTRAFEWGNPPRPVILGHTWSLSIEEQFYFLWPVTLLFLRSKFAKAYSLVIIFLLIGIVMMWRIHLLEGGANIWRLSNGTDTKIDVILIGCALAFIVRYQKHPAPIVAHLMSLVSAGVIASIAYMVATTELATPSLFIDGFTMVALGVACVIWTITSGTETILKRALALAPLAYLGRISYGVYLFHWPIINLVPQHLPFSIGWAVIGVQVALPIALAAISFKFIERPMLDRSTTTMDRQSRLLASSPQILQTPSNFV